MSKLVQGLDAENVYGALSTLLRMRRSHLHEPNRLAWAVNEKVTTPSRGRVFLLLDWRAGGQKPRGAGHCWLVSYWLNFPPTVVRKLFQFRRGGGIPCESTFNQLPTRGIRLIDVMRSRIVRTG